MLDSAWAQRLGTLGPLPPRGCSRYVDITGEFHLDLIQDQDTLLLQNKLEGSKYKRVNPKP